MKKVLLSVLFAAIAITAFQSCKKGENDPAISLRSRDARLIAKWKLTKIEGSETSITSGVTQTTTKSYDGTTYTVSQVPGSTDVGTGTYEMEIKKDGKMSWSETFTSGTPAVTTNLSNSTIWFWLDGGKSKTIIMLQGGDVLFPGGISRIDRLANKELVIIMSGSSSHNGDSDSGSFKYTFTAQ
ncbi:MAG: hypothetical protein WCL06_05500 [Bacteroidota bacterium]